MTFYGICQKCFKPVTSERDRPAFPIVGYEVLRDGGGANAIRNRKRTGGVWHETCLPREDPHENQEAMAL